MNNMLHGLCANGSYMRLFNNAIIVEPITKASKCFTATTRRHKNYITLETSSDASFSGINAFNSYRELMHLARAAQYQISILHLQSKIFNLEVRQVDAETGSFQPTME